jgi:hypothetical protein
MKRAAFICLYYGKDWLAWAVKAAQEAVDEIHVIYTDRPSFGNASSVPCPETEDELKREAHRFLKKPIFWHRGNFPNESAHRDTIFPIMKDHDVNQILVVDSDEIFDPVMARAALEAAAQNGSGRVLMRFMHFFRSFRWVCHDPCMPVRILNLGSDGRPKSGEWYLSPQLRPVWHMGYLQTIRAMKAKWAGGHGHQAELKPNWLVEKYCNFQPGVTTDVHPCNGWDPNTKRYFWQPEPTDPETMAAMHPWLSDHPWWNETLVS